MPDTGPASLLAARLDVAERIALAASPDGRTEWRADIQRNDEGQVAGPMVTAWPGAMPVLAAQSLGAVGEAAVTHVASRDPGQTLADIAADRDILADYAEAVREVGADSAEARTLERVIEVRTGAWAE
jgi:hypothetical protein